MMAPRRRPGLALALVAAARGTRLARPPSVFRHGGELSRARRSRAWCRAGPGAPRSRDGLRAPHDPITLHVGAVPPGAGLPAPVHDTTRVGDLLRNVPFPGMNGTVGRISPLPADSGDHLALRTRPGQGGRLRPLEAADDAVVVWIPGERSFDPRLELPILELAVPRFYRREATVSGIGDPAANPPPGRVRKPAPQRPAGVRAFHFDFGLGSTAAATVSARKPMASPWQINWASSRWSGVCKNGWPFRSGRRERVRRGLDEHGQRPAVQVQRRVEVEDRQPFSRGVCLDGWVVGRLKARGGQLRHHTAIKALDVGVSAGSTKSASGWRNVGPVCMFNVGPALLGDEVERHGSPG